MKTIQRVTQKLAVSLIALAVLSLATQAMAQQATALSAKVLRIKGAARYSTDGKNWHPLHIDDILKLGAVIQTAEKSYVDVQLGEREVKAPTQVVNNGVLYSPQEPTANVVRIFESSVLAIDKLTAQQTGMEEVEDTSLDLRAGKIMGNVKKLSAASKYEVKIPNGVAGIRGTIYMISSSGVVDVLQGSVVIAVVGADGSVVTKVVNAGYQYDPLTQAMTPISEADQKALMKIYLQLNGPPSTPPATYVKNGTIIYVSPLNQPGGGTPPPPAPPEGGGVGTLGIQ
jgi:FecR protein